MPILVPRNEHFTQLLIANIHAGVSHTLTQLRKKYWIPQGRRTIKHVIRNCLTCIRYQGGPCQAKVMHLGQEIKRRNHHHSTTLALITLVHCASKTKPKEELSPWMEGFYERLVGITKTALKKTIGKLYLTHTQLQTIITEVEAVINSRPLVYVDDDLENEIITPNHFLSLNTKNGTTELIRNNEDDDKNDPDYQNEELTTAHKLLEHWKKDNKRLEQFWKVWKDGYLLNLRERNQLFQKHPRIQAKKCPKIGDIVQIKDSLPRRTWRMGCIVEMIRSSDGEERAARVMMPNRNILQRSIIHLYPIECNDEEPNKENDSNWLNHNNLKVKHDEKTTQEQDKNNETAKRHRPYEGQLKKQETR